MGQITTALSRQLVIENIDENDRENPQLCAEYVKEIYEYMRELEVSVSLSNSVCVCVGCPKRCILGANSG